MIRRLLLAWAAAFVALLAATVIRWRREESVASPRFVTPFIVDAPVAAAERAAPTFAAKDPFRLANRPTRVRYSSAPIDPAFVTPAIAREPHPAMTLRAVAGGPPWQALIEGLPGQTHTTLVRTGTVVERLTVRAITRDSVVIRDRDTTFVLTFARRQ